MNDQIVSFKVAELAKRLGFGHLDYTENIYFYHTGVYAPNCAHHEIDSERNFYKKDMQWTSYKIEEDHHYFEAPTQTMLGDWLRAKGYFTRMYFPAFTDKGVYYGYQYNFLHCANEEWIDDKGIYDTWEEAKEDSLLYGLVWLKSNQ